MLGSKLMLAHKSVTYFNISKSFTSEPLKWFHLMRKWYAWNFKLLKWNLEVVQSEVWMWISMQEYDHNEQQSIIASLWLQHS